MRLRLALLVSVMPSLACAGFSIEGASTVSSDNTSIGRYTPYEERGLASFKKPEGEKKPQQERYADAELLVDMAYRPVTQTGSGEAPLLSGFADEVPFTQAMTLILPSGWQLYRDKGLDSSEVPELVSFQGGKPWPDVLGDLGGHEGLHFHVDWYQRTVMMNKGRQLTPNYKRIRVIAEPPRPTPTIKPLALGPEIKSPAHQLPPPAATATAVVAEPIKPAQPLVTEMKPATPVAASKPGDKGTAAAPAAPVVAHVPQPAAPKPVPKVSAEIRLDILPGTLRSNVIRLSAQNGWKKPDWKIPGDYRIDAGYTLSGKNFAEAMAKLLLLHPIEADVNVAQRKVIVYREVN